jgi:arylsulfatase A-like enzyme
MKALAFLAFYFAAAVRGEGDDDIDGFLFNISEDPYEDTNLYADSDYINVVESLESRLDYWSEKVQDPEVPDNYSSRTTFWANQNNIVTTWLTDSFDPLQIERRYNYKNAPNIVFVFVDDWGWNDVGFRSTYMSWTTPTIDKLASEGVVLENYYSFFSCIPSRSALLTGRYSIRTGLYGAGEGAELPLSEVTLAQELKSAGYRTYMVGKWHLGMSSVQHTPLQRGFDYFYGYWNGYIDYWTKSIHGFFDLHDGDEVVTNEDEIDSSLHTAYLFEQKVEKVIQEHSENYSDQPMFLYYAMQLIHGPWSAPQAFLDRCGYPSDEETDDYVQSVEYNYCGLNLLLDEVIANLTCALEKTNMADNTLLLIVSDNGGEATMPGNCYPWRGQKGSYYRGGLMTTAIVHSKLLPKESWGTSYNGLVHVTGEIG